MCHFGVLCQLPVELLLTRGKFSPIRCSMNRSFTCGFQRTSGPWEFRGNQPQLRQNVIQYQYQQQQQNQYFYNQPCNQNTYANNFQQFGSNVSSVIPKQIWNSLQSFDQNCFQNYEHENVHQQHQHNQNQFPAWPSQHGDVMHNTQYGRPMHIQGCFDHGEKWSSQDTTSSQNPPSWNLSHPPAWNKPHHPTWKKSHPPTWKMSHPSFTKQLPPPAFKSSSRVSSLVSINCKKDRASVPKADINNKHSSIGEALGKQVKESKGDNTTGDTLTVLTNDNTDANSELSNYSCPNNCNVLENSSKSSDEAKKESHKAMNDSQEVSSDSLQLKKVIKGSENKSEVLKIKVALKDKHHIGGIVTEPNRKSEEFLINNRLVLQESKDSLKNRSEVLEVSYNKNIILKESNVLKSSPDRNENDIMKESHVVSKDLIGNLGDILNKSENTSKHSLDISPVLKEQIKFAPIQSRNKSYILKESNDTSKHSGETSIRVLKEADEVLKDSHQNKVLKVPDKSFKELIEHQNEILVESSKTSETLLEHNEFLKESTMSHTEELQYSSKNMETNLIKNSFRESDSTNKRTYENCIDKFRHSSKNKNEVLKDSAKQKCEEFMHEKKKSNLKDIKKKRKGILKDLRILKRKASDDSVKYKHKRVKLFVNKDRSALTNSAACKSDIICSLAIDHRNITSHSSPNSSTMLKSIVNRHDGMLEETHENNSELPKYSTKKKNDTTNSNSRTRGNDAPRMKAKTSSRELKPELTSSPKSEKSEAVTQSLMNKSQLEQPLMTTDKLVKQSPPCSSKEVICYTCKNVVKEYQLSSHLYFGSLKCRDCSKEITSCRTFREMRRATEAKRSSSCLHRSLKWLSNPFSYIKNKLQKKLRKINLKGELTEEDLIVGVSTFARRLRALEHKSPWRSAIEKLRRSLAPGIPSEDLTNVEKDCNLALCDLARIETEPEGYNTHFSDERNSSCKSRGEEHEIEEIQKENPNHSTSMPTSLSGLLENALEDMRNLSSIESQKASETSPVDSERIPQIVEEEVIIPQTMWEDDIICFGRVEQVDENIISDSVCKDSSIPKGVGEGGTVGPQNPGHTFFCLNADEQGRAKAELSEQAVSDEQIISEECELAYGSVTEFTPKKASKMELITQQSLIVLEETGKVQLLTEEVRMSKLVQEIEVAPEVGEKDFQPDMNRAEIIPKEVKSEPVKVIAEKQEYDAMNSMKLDIPQAEQEKIREETIKAVKEASRKCSHVKKPFKMDIQGEEESQIFKRYNLRRRRHQPFLSFLQRLQKQYKNSEFWTHILPAAKAFHEHTTREEAGDSLDLNLNSEEVDDEFMLDILLSQDYGQQHMDKITEFISEGDHSIVSQVKDVIKNPPIFVNKPDLISSHLTRSSSRAVLKSYSKSQIQKRDRMHTRKRVQEERTSPKAHLDPMVFGKDIPQNEISKIHIVTPPDGFYYVVTYPAEPCPTECPMCYYRIFPSMFCLNLVTNLATARCFGCPLTIYVVHEPVDTYLPKIIFKSNKGGEETVVTEKPYKPKPARFKVTLNKSKKRRRLSIHQFIKK